MKTAGARQPGRNPPLVQTEKGEDQSLHFWNTRSTSLSSCACGASALPRLKFQTIHHSGPSFHSSRRTVSLKRRFMRFRRTALPSPRVVVKPTFGPSPAADLQQKATKLSLGIRNPESYTCRKSLDFNNRRSFGKLSRRGSSELLCVPDGSFVTDRQLVPATRPAASQHRPPVLGLHAHAEAVCFGPLVIVRLKRSLRHCFFLTCAPRHSALSGHRDTPAPLGSNLSIGSTRKACQTERLRHGRSSGTISS